MHIRMAQSLPLREQNIIAKVRFDALIWKPHAPQQAVKVSQSSEFANNVGHRILSALETTQNGLCDRNTGAQRH